MMRDNIKNSYDGIYVFEGIDNIGKTTIVQSLQKKICEEMGSDCITIAFPGNETRTLGALVYDIHHHVNKYFDFPINVASLQLLHVAAHIDLIKRKLLNKDSSSKIILMDRFWWSTYVYGLVGGLERDAIRSILAPELEYWKNIKINKIFLLERKDREINYEENKDSLIMWHYNDLARRESKCQIINNDGRLEETINRVFNNIVGA